MSFMAAAKVFFLDQTRLFWQRHLCYDVNKTMLFVIMAASFVLFGIQISLFWWRHLYYNVIKKGVICYLCQYCILRCYQSRVCCSIAKVTLLVAVLLRQYYSSYSIANSRCSGLKAIGSILFVSENFQSSTVLLEYHWSKVISSNVVSAICPSVMFLNRARIY